MIIRSILDTDVYKLTMQQAVIACYPDEIVRYALIMRSKRAFPPGFGKELEKHVHAMAQLQLDQTERAYLLESCPYFKSPYLDFLTGYRFNPDEVTIEQKNENLTVTIEGYWYRTILWEVPLLVLISELFFSMGEQPPLGTSEVRDRTAYKAAQLEAIGASFIDFGTRRRLSLENQDLVIDTCRNAAPGQFLGTSNLLLAKKHGCRVFGTQAHEWYMAIAAREGFTNANKTALEKWVEVYQGQLGIALTDTFTSEAFFKEFSGASSRLFDGLRQDSGDPFAFTCMAIDHYRRLGINPAGKILIFSDSLNIDGVRKIHAFCAGKVRDTFGIGTNLTNDAGVEPLNMVIKLTGLKKNGYWIPTVKLSDGDAKRIGSDEAAARCRIELGLHSPGGTS